MQTFLTHEKQSQREFSAYIKRTEKAIRKAFKKSFGAAYSGLTPQKLAAAIKTDTILPEKGMGFDKVLVLAEKTVLPNLLCTPSSSYMAHLHGPSLLETIAAELVISTFNQSMDSWDQSPVATEIEVQVIRALCDLYGYNKTSDGVFTSGGSQSNQTAIILARDWFCNEILHWDVKKYGLPPQYTKLRMYTSEISHFSMEKSAHILGLGYESVVKVPVDAKKKMDTVLLKKLVEQDIKAGNIPFLVVGTVGTTDFGSIDDLNELYEIARNNNMWLHADAAYGSGVIMSRKYRELITGIELCDSITLDFHKMFLMPISCSAVLVKDGKDFEALTVHADYLNRTEDEEDGYTNLVDKSIQTTRRFDALKVWTAFQVRGKDGWSELIETSMENARYFYNQLKDDSNFEVVTEPEISSVVFRFCDGNKNTDEINKKVRRRLIHEYGTIIGQTVSDGKVCLKFTLLNPLITHKKLDELKSLITAISKTAAEE